LGRDPVEPLALAQPDLGADPVAEALERHVDVERVRRALHTLSDRQRTTITLAYYHGFSGSEIAELLGVPLGTIKTRMRDGLARLRAMLGED
jgi:RNA polymerase sigma-70 factor (ECF subfamily)